MQRFCPCNRHRGNMSFKEAMRHAKWLGLVRKHGVEGARRVKERERVRLERLREAR